MGIFVRFSSQVPNVQARFCGRNDVYGVVEVFLIALQNDAVGIYRGESVGKNRDGNNSALAGGDVDVQRLTNN